MSKIYDKSLLYIPSDLVGNAALDQIRKKFGLEKGTTLEGTTDISNIAFSSGKITFKPSAELVTATTKTKIYDFRVEDFSDSATIKEKYEALAEKIGVFLASIIMAAVVYGSIKKLIGTPILDKDLFFDTSFFAGEIRDKSSLPATGTPQEESISKTQSAQALYYYYKIQSHFTKFIANDPYKRFSGNSSTDSDLVPSFYKFVESNYYTPSHTGLVPKLEIKNLNYSLLETPKLGHMVFFDYDTYGAFLMGCADLAKHKLRSIAKYNENLSSQGVKLPITELQDYLPFYTKIQFSTEKDVSTSGFSFSSFLNSPPIRPFFQQFLGLYVDVVENPKKYEGKSWLDSSEEYSIFDPETGKLYDKFNTRVITATPLIKDSSFLNFQLGKTSGTPACANIQKKISSLLFSKKVTELLMSTLEDDESLFKNANYSETICYRVTRTDKFTGKVTHWVVPNFPALPVIELFDTNLRFDRGQDAHYEVFSLKACVALNYEYKTYTGQTKGDKYKTGFIYPKTVWKRKASVPGDKAWTTYTTDEKDAKLDDDGNPVLVAMAGDVQYKTIEDVVDLISAGLIIDKMSEKNPIADLKFTVAVTPSINFVEIPYFSKDDVVIYDSAPARPNLRLFAYRGVDNQVTALFGGYVDQYKAKREPILLGDELINNNAEKYARQFYSFRLDELYYKSEMEDVDIFELFVLEEPPRRLEDFRNARRIEIKNTASPLAIAALTADDIPYGSSYTLDIEPNKNYWLMARVKDFNQNISNTSEIYKIHIINDDGYINPTFQLFDMAKPGLPKEADPSPDFMKLVYIAPSPQHVEPFHEDSENITAGDGDTQPWKKGYQIRITSKKTNKKMDINVFFDREIKNIKSVKDLPANYTYQVIDFEESGDVTD